MPRETTGRLKRQDLFIKVRTWNVPLIETWKTEPHREIVNFSTRERHFLGSKQESTFRKRHGPLRPRSSTVAFVGCPRHFSICNAETQSVEATVRRMLSESQISLPPPSLTTTSLNSSSSISLNRRLRRSGHRPTTAPRHSFRHRNVPPSRSLPSSFSSCDAPQPIDLTVSAHSRRVRQQFRLWIAFRS